jgi:hypothetical protein
VVFLRGVPEDESAPHTVWRWDKVSTNYETDELYASRVIHSFFTGDEARQLASYLEDRGDANVCVERVNLPVDMERFAAEHPVNTFVEFDDYDRPVLGLDIIGWPIEPRHLVKSAVITVGDGRGFVVEGTREIRAPGQSKVYRFPQRYVITAAHCLPFFPPCMTFSHEHERSYKNLLGPLTGEPTVWAQCLFVDPIADIAVLGAVDNQVFGEQADLYEALVESGTPLPISDAPEHGAGWLLSLTYELMPCTVKHLGGPLWIEGAADIKGGMSGSPILAADHSAIGVICTGSGAPQAHLTQHLPGWLLRELTARPAE